MLSRRTLLRILAIAALVAVVIGVPLALTAKASFFGRYPALSDQYEPWSRSSHLEAGCDGCHVRPDAVSRTFYRTTMIGEFYLSLASRQRVPGFFGRPTNEACMSCHSDLRTVSPVGDLQIPHRAHVDVLQMRCVDCHKYLVHEASPEGKHLPRMADCMTCHNGDKAKDTCTACHTAKAAPESHQAADWPFTHAEQSKSPECESCHKWRADWCSDCHRRRPKSHTAEWRADHRDQVEKQRDCEACHVSSFCIRCHGEYPKKNLDSNLRLVR